jgi:hypothetical protein
MYKLIIFEDCLDAILGNYFIEISALYIDGVLSDLYILGHSPDYLPSENERQREKDHGRNEYCALLA